MLKFASLALAGLVSFNVFAGPIQDSVKMELSFIKRIFETGYAPTAWKNEHFGWDLNTEYQNSVQVLTSKGEDLSATDYRKLVKDFLGSTRDYHVGVQFFSTESASLPFLVNGVDGRFFIVWMDPTKIDQTTFPFRLGDEVVKFDGKPVADVVAALKADMGHTEDHTDQRLAERMLTRRVAAMAMDVPRGPVDVEVKRKSDGKLLKRQMAWEYLPETVDWRPSLMSPLIMPMDAPARTFKFSKPQMSWGMYDTWRGAEIAAAAPENVFQVGGRKSYVPDLGEIVWDGGDALPLRAYIYKLDDGRKIGYVRIPSYMGKTQTFILFKEIVRIFEAQTDGMIIDQINNPGGSVFYVLALMSVLSPDPIKVPDHHVTLWPTEVQENVELVAKLQNVKNDADARAAFEMADIDGFPVTFQFAMSALDFGRSVLADWKAGLKITKPLHLIGVDRVNPDPEVNYSKPILVLTNELDFSGGDFFPAILQDNKRAKIFGQRTSGAGGYVKSVEFPSALGLKAFQFTGSLARRIDNTTIENLGVTPDIPYKHTVRDLTDGYVDYKNAINQAIGEML